MNSISKHAFKTALVTLGVLLFANTLIAQVMQKQPYLIFEGKHDEMAVHWQLYKTEVSAVSLGTDETYSIGTYETTEYNISHQHKFIFKNLLPATKYFYKVTAGAETYMNTFYTAPDPETKNVKFLAYGDTRNNYMDHDMLAATILESFNEGYQTMSLAVGDYTDAGDSEADWNTEYFNPAMTNVRKLFGSIPIQGAQGDHESAADRGKLYKKYLPYPFIDSIATYWSFDYGPVHFILYDQFVSQVATGKAYKWMEQDLASTDKPWKIVLIHRPGWSTGSNGNMGAIQQIYQPLFKKYNVQMVIAGHNHLYARATVDGIKHITTGGGGAPLYDPSSADKSPNIEISAKTYHYCKINIEGDIMHFTAVGADGRVIDDFTMNAVTSVEIDEKEAGQPQSYKLFDAYPNPFNPSTKISFALPERSSVRLEIFDALGKLVSKAIDTDLETGVYHFNWNAAGLSSGMYIYKLTAGNFVSSKKLTLIK